MKTARAALTALLAGLLGACANTGYYAQSVEGHLELMAAREPIDGLLDAPETPVELREQLARVRAINHFAHSRLGLPDNGSYTSYADVGRPYVVWTVVAAPELSLEPLTWCFPFAGCVSYRGYFSRPGAEAFAQALRGDGLDVTVAGVRAYSTLGWFEDPVVSPMLDLPPYLLAGTIFHELAHQRLYVPGDTAFNEAFAVTVEREGVRRWLRAAGDAGQSTAYRDHLDRRQAFLAVVLPARETLVRLYASDVSDAEKRRGKQDMLVGLRREHEALMARWGGYAGYATWFDQGLNNARIASVATYHRQVPALERLLARQGGDLEAFYAECEKLAALDAGERARRLEALSGV